MNTGDTPCQRICAPHRTESFRPGSRKRLAFCTLAPDRAWLEHPPAGTAKESRNVHNPASTAGHTTLHIQSKSASMDTGSSPCQRTCVPNRILSCRLGSRKKRASCTRALDSAVKQHPPARHPRTEWQKPHVASTAGHTTLPIHSKSASMDTGDTPCQRTCAPNRIEPVRLESRKRVPFCIRAPGNAYDEHPPAGTSDNNLHCTHLASTAGHTILLVRSKLTSTCTGNTPCQQTCASHRIEPFRLGCRKRVASCTPAPGSALRQHLPAHMLRERCRSAPQAKCTTVDTVRTPRQNRPAGLFPLACNSTWKGALLLMQGLQTCLAILSHRALFLATLFSPPAKGERCTCGAHAAQAGLAMPSALCCPQASGRPPSKLYRARLSQPSVLQRLALCTTCACGAVVGGQPARESDCQGTAPGAPAWVPCSQAAVRGAW